MASNPAVENGAIRGPPHQKPGQGDYLIETATLEDTLRQMNVLMKENKELKDALKQTNASMRERFEGLTTWKEKQKEERDFLEEKLAEAKDRVSILTKRNEELKKRLQTLEGADGAVEGEAGRWSLEIEALKAQIARLQAEKSDLVAMNSELQLKMRPCSPEDPFVEIQIPEGGVDVNEDLPNGQSHMTRSHLTVSRQDSEEHTVSQLLQSLRKEIQRVEKLELELLASRERVSELEAVKQGEVETPIVLAVRAMEGSAAVSRTKGETRQEAPRKEADGEMENLKGQMGRLIKELQHAQSKLDDAEDMKKSLHDRCRDMERETAMLRAQLVQKQQSQTENLKLKLHLESMIKVEQNKAGDERCRDMEKDRSMLKAQLAEKQQVQKENEQLKLQVESMQSMVNMEQEKAGEERCRDMENDLSMLKAQLAEKQEVQAENEKLKLQLESMQSTMGMAEKERRRDMEKDLTMLQAQLVEKQQVQTENEKLKLQVESMQSMVKIEQKKADDERKNMAQVKDEYTKLFEDYKALKQEMKKKEPIMTNEEVKELQVRLDSAEQALVAKQQKIDEMKQEIFKTEKELETISVFQAQAEVYSSDFYAEREAREKIHEEKERLAAQLEFVKQQYGQLQEEMESMGRQSLNEMQRRHMSLGAGPLAGGQQRPQLGERGTGGRDWQQQMGIPEHACPKCNEILPDLDSLQIHIMDCII